MQVEVRLKTIAHVPGVGLVNVGESKMSVRADGAFYAWAYRLHRSAGMSSAVPYTLESLAQEIDRGVVVTFLLGDPALNTTITFAKEAARAEKQQD